jgi:hypothetical protein
MKIKRTVLVLTLMFTLLLITTSKTEKAISIPLYGAAIHGALSL